MNAVRSMGSLPIQERRVFTLRMVYGYTSLQISLRLNLTEPGVNAILALAVQHFADALERR